MAWFKNAETKSFMAKMLKAGAAISSAALLFACGDDSGSNSDAPEKIELVSSIDDLEKCTDEFEGNTVFVKEEKSDFVCQKGKWMNVDTQNSSSSSRVYEPDSGAYIQPEVVKIKNKSISGVSQKGPFVTGSTVKLYELDGKTLASTGKSFPGKIVSDDGKFSVSNIDLESQYALLEANGYFRNEHTGEKSQGVITLNALTDLSDRKSVNINLLTHLEYDRVLYLIGTGISVSAAKKQAEVEILKAFGINGNFANSEDLDIFSKGDGNAALLAISVLMLSGNLNAAKLTERMTKFAMDIEKDGSWDDEKTKAEIADWAWYVDREEWYLVSNGLKGERELSYLRRLIEKWNLGDVPEFEKYVRNFWREIYGFGNCDISRDGEVMAIKNEYSVYNGPQTRYICKNGVWEEASDLEKDTYKWGNGKDGEIKVGDVSGAKYKYDEKFSEWEKADSLDISLNMTCTSSREGSRIKNEKGIEFYCTEHNDYTNGDKIHLIHEWANLTDGWNWGVPRELRLNSEINYGTMVDTRDNKVYKTVKIGDQVWMAENLNYADSVATPSLRGGEFVLW